MPIRRGSRSVSTLMGGDLAVDIDHTTDSITLGDELHKMVLESVGGTWSIPVKVMSTTTDSILTGGTQKTQLTDGVDDVQIEDVAGEKALKVAVISTVGNTVISATDGDTFTAGDTDFSPIGGQYDANGSEDLADGDMGVVRITSERSMHVHVTGTDVGSSGGTSATDDSAFTAGTTAVTPIGAVFDDTSTDSVDEGDVGAVRMTADRVLMVRLQQVGSVTVPISAASLPLPTDAATATNQTTANGHLSAIKTAVETIDNAISGSEMQVDIVNTPTVTVGNASIAVTGTFWQTTQPVSGTVTANLAAGTNNIGDVDVLTLPGVAGTAAHDAAVSGNPVRIGGRAMLANGTAVSEDDTVDIACDNQGRQVVTPHVPRDLVAQATGSINNTTEATMLAAGGSGVFHDVTKLIFTNSNTTTAAQVQVRDASTGTIRLELMIAPNGGAVIDFGAVPMVQTTANNAWTIDLNASVSTVYWFIQAIKRIA